MSNIEDDLKILENAIKCNKKQFEELGTHILLQDDEQEALEHLLSHYKNMKFNYENLIHDISLIAESLGMQEDSTIEEIAIRISEEMYNQQQINEEHQKLNGELREKVKELEEERQLVGMLVKNKRDGRIGIVLHQWENGSVAVLESINPRVINTHDSWNTLEIITDEVKQVQTNSDNIAKQKIKDKIEEINKSYEESKNEFGESEYYYPDYTITRKRG